MELSACFSLAWRTLRRNGLRSALTLLGITIGVGAVLTMVAVGNGARASIEDQVAAAGMNVITVTAGNYKMKGETDGGGVADHQAAWLVEPDDDPDANTPNLDRYVPAVYHPDRDTPVFSPSASRPDLTRRAFARRSDACPSSRTSRSHSPRPAIWSASRR